jgi:hypothetical protein
LPVSAPERRPEDEVNLLRTVDVRKPMRRVLAIALLAVLPGASADATTITFKTPLAPEAVGATGSGTVTVVYDDIVRTLSIDAAWSGLSGTTTAAHIHCCTASPGTGTAGVAVTPVTLPGFPTGVTAGSYFTLLDLSSASTYTAAFLTGGGGTAAGAEARLVAGMLAGTAYFNVHSTTFGGGEVRGFLARVPDPGSSLLLLGMGLVGLRACRKRLG